MLSILKEPKNALSKQYQKLFSYEGIELIFEEGVFEFIVDKAGEFKLGARGLRSICEAIMLDAMFDIPSQEHKEGTEFRITLDYAKRQFSKSDIKKLDAA